MTQPSQMLYEQTPYPMVICVDKCCLRSLVLLTCGYLLTVQSLSCRYHREGEMDRRLDCYIACSVISQVLTRTVQRDLKSHGRWTWIPTGHLVTWSRIFFQNLCLKNTEMKPCSSGYIRTLKTLKTFAHELLAYQVFLASEFPWIWGSAHWNTKHTFFRVSQGEKSKPGQCCQINMMHNNDGGRV